MNEVQVLVTGLAWMGSGVRSIETTLEELLQSAQDEILITAYAISNTSNKFIGKLESVLAHGIKVQMIVNQITTQPRPVVTALQSLASTYPHFHLYSFESMEGMSDLHAKTIVIDRKKALIGSANLSFRGWTTNHELAVLITGEAANEIASVIDRLRFSKFCKEVK